MEQDRQKDTVKSLLPLAVWDSVRFEDVDHEPMHYLSNYSSNRR